MPQAPLVPRPKQRELTRAEIRRLEAAQRAIRMSEAAWAVTVRELGIAACARHLGITPQALSGRLRVIEARD